MKRGVSDFNIDEGEPENVDHLLFLVHGIGSVCDLKFRSVEEVGECGARYYLHPSRIKFRCECLCKFFCRSR